MKPKYNSILTFLSTLLLLGFAFLSACGTLEVGIETPAALVLSPTAPSAGVDTPYPVPDGGLPPIPDPGTVNGTICFPSEFVPAMTAYFQNMETDEVTELPIVENQTEYTVDLEPGVYIAYAYLPDGSFGGMYSEAVACGLDISCADHSPLVFEVAAGAATNGIAICDWYAQEALPPRPIGTPLAGLVYRIPFNGAVYQVDSTGRHREVYSDPGGLISPDGQAVLFKRDQDLWIADLQTGEARNLTNTPDRVEIDGQWWPANPGTIVFGSWDSAEEMYISTGYLSIISADGSDYRVLDGEVASIAPPGLSPDGRTIAYDRGGTAWLYRLDTGLELFDPASYGLEAAKGITLGSPAWSPDGSRLAWWAGGGFGEGGDWALTLAVFDLQSRTVQRVYTYTPVGGSEGWLPVPVWSPDGRWLAVTTRGELDRVNLWVVRAEGDERFPLGRSESPVWRPDSQALVYTRWIEKNGLYQDTETIIVTIGDWSEEQLFFASGSYPQSWLTGQAVYQGTSEPWFSAQVSFGISPEASPPQQAFPAGTKQVYAMWSYANMRDGLTVRQEWVLDGGILQSQVEPWDYARYGASGVFRDASISDMDNGLPPGTYQLRLYIDGQEQTVQEDPVSSAFTISLPLDVPAQTAPDGSRVALVEAPGTLLIQDASGRREPVLTATEISSLAWFPDSVNLLYGVRESSGLPLDAGPISVAQSLWVMNVVTGEAHQIASAADNMHDPRIAPDGRYVAVIGGTGYADACFVDRTLWVLQLDDQNQLIYTYYQLDFDGLPDAGSAYVVDLFKWESESAFTVSLGWVCNDQGLDGVYRLDLSSRTAERVE